MKAKIYLFSRPIRTGKTTELQSWLSLKTNVDGVLMPDIEGKRHLQFFKENRLISIEANEDEKHYSIGKFKFKIEPFEQAKQYLLEAVQQEIDFLVIDEIGKLELQNNLGFEPGLSKLIEIASQKNVSLIIVVRTSLLDEMIQHYQINDAIIIETLNQFI